MLCNNPHPKIETSCRLLNIHFYCLMSHIVKKHPSTLDVINIETIFRHMLHRVEVFYDGGCPLCSREVSFLRARAHRGEIKFTDITALGFDPHPPGFTQAEMMSEIRGRARDGRLISGVEVFRQMYAAVGFIKLVRLSRLAPIDWLLRVAYRTFARNRLKLTGRCDTACSVTPNTSSPKAIKARV